MISPGKKIWQMTKTEFLKERRLRNECRRDVASNKKKAQAQARESNFPVGHVYGWVEWMADQPNLTKVDHKTEVAEALGQGKEIPPDVLLDYPELVDLSKD